MYTRVSFYKIESGEKFYSLYYVPAYLKFSQWQRLCSYGHLY